MSLFERLRNALPKTYVGDERKEALNARHTGQLHRVNLADRAIETIRGIWAQALNATGNEQYQHIKQSCKDLAGFLEDRVGVEHEPTVEQLLGATKDWVVVHGAKPAALLAVCSSEEAVFDTALIRHIVHASEDFGFHDKNSVLMALADRMVNMDAARSSPELTAGFLNCMRGGQFDRVIDQAVVENTVILRAEMGGSYGTAEPGTAQASLYRAMQDSLLEYAKSTHNLPVLSALSLVEDTAIAREVRFNASRFLNVDSEVAQVITERCDSTIAGPLRQQASDLANAPR